MKRQIHRKHRRGIRSENGLLGLVALLFAIFVILVAAAFFTSISHALTVKAELQNAADAAAIAAAQDLCAEPEKAEIIGKSVAAMNRADGRPVSSKSSGTSVRVLVHEGINGESSRVELITHMKIQNLFGGLGWFGKEASVSAHSMAGTTGGIVTLGDDQAFPLAISIDAVPMCGRIASEPLRSHHLGDIVCLYTNAQQRKNVAFTSFLKTSDDLAYIRKVLDARLHMTADAQSLLPGENATSERLVPNLAIGDSIYLNHGSFGQNYLATGGRLEALMRHPTITVPVIVGNPQVKDKATIVGFLTVRVVGCTLNAHGQELDSLTVQLIKGIVSGKSGLLPSTNEASTDAALEELSSGTMKLLSPDQPKKRPANAGGSLVASSQPLPAVRRTAQHAQAAGDSIMIANVPRAIARTTEESVAGGRYVQSRASLTDDQSRDAGVIVRQAKESFQPLSQSSWLWLMALITAFLCLVFALQWRADFDLKASR
jgi:hypothetical protein